MAAVDGFASSATLVAMRVKSLVRWIAISSGLAGRLALLSALAAILIAAPAAAQQKDEQAPPQIRELMRIIEDPEVKSWLSTHAEPAPGGENAATPANPISPAEYLVTRIGAVHQHLVDLVVAFPTLPDQFAGARAMVAREIVLSGSGRILMLIGLFVGSGIVAEVLLRWSVSGFVRWTTARPSVTVAERFQVAGLRLSYGIASVVAFAIGSIGLFLLIEWPLLLREIVIGYLLVFVLARAALACCRFVTSPDDERWRLVPIDRAAAVHWCRRTAVIAGCFAFGWITASLLSRLGFTVPARQLVSYAFGFVLLLLCIEAIWRRPRQTSDVGETQGEGAPPSWRRTKNALLSAYLVLLWGLWAVGMMPAFWFCFIALALPPAIWIASGILASLMQPPDESADSQTSTAWRMLAERGMRALLIIAAAVLLARAWNIDLTHLGEADTLATRLLRGLVSAVAIILVAEIAWRIIRALIDRKLSQKPEASPPGSPEARARARMRTLLPILRNVLLVVLLTMSALMVLSAMGIEIGPLIAGAGVAGVAIGFGAQTLVKDIIAGVFYLLDDAFRVGEYIQSGSYKGTVEAFSLRSVKLRHHRGSLYTVPFGELGAVQNMSRDWVIDKMMVGITYDSDIDKAKKIIKQIGKDLAADPEFAPHIIEPLKMQGVEQFGDYAVQIRMKMMTKPNEQFTIRRKALALIKKAFDANGIHFATPTVQVAGSEVAAAAQQALAVSRPAANQT